MRAFAAAVAVGATVSVPTSGLLAQSFVRDSAGVRIVTNPAIVQEAFVLAEQPITEALVAPGQTDLRSWTRASAVLTANGSLLARSSGRWHAFDAAGMPRPVAERAPPAPSKLKLLGPDTIAAYVRSTNRIVFMDASAQPIELVPMPITRMHLNADVAGVLEDGSAVVAVRANPYNSTPEPRSEFVTCVVFSRRGEERVRLGPFRNGSGFGAVSRGPSGNVAVLPSYRPAFSSQLHVRAGARHLYVGEAMSYEVRVYSAGGILERIVRAERVASTVTEEDRAAFRAQSGATADMALAVASDTLPAYSRIEVDDAERLWIRDYRSPSAMQRWVAFDSTGMQIGSLHLRESSVVLDIHEDRLLVSEIEPARGEFIRVYGFSRIASRDPPDS